MTAAERRFVPQEHVPLAPFSTLGVGGSARWFARAESIDDVAAAHRWCEERQARLFVLGGGSNLVIADEGIDGLILHIALRGIEIASVDRHTHVTAAAGEPWDDIVATAVARGLAGIECLSGIPGSVGGTPIQNVGAYGQEVADTIHEVVVFDRSDARMITLAGAACGFAYRQSRFKADDAGRFIVCSVTFRLQPGKPTARYPDLVRYLDGLGIVSPGVNDVRNAVLAVRRTKGMVVDSADADTRSVGSFFMNPVVAPEIHARIDQAEGAGSTPGFVLASGDIKIPAAWLIERSGFSKGYQRGTVGLSSKHPLAIVNRGGATARDVLDLARHVKRGVVERFGIWLRPEPIFVGFGQDPDVEYLLRANP